ncbi:MAG: hypothetical protein IJD89_08300 [Clostridia bacterium]|nr:hypothetical protein [Clostridia bacterium]
MARIRVTEKIEELPKAVKVLLFLFPLTGWVLSSFYRFFRYSETREIVTLVVGVIGLVSGIGIIFGWADALSEMKHNKATFFVD